MDRSPHFQSWVTRSRAVETLIDDAIKNAEQGYAPYGTNLPNPTAATYGAYTYAYDCLNKVLFGGQLTPCLLTLQRRRGAAGFYANGRFQAQDGSHRVSELATNPSCAAPYVTVAEKLSTIAHELCHHWQALNGRPGRWGYHNKAWAAKMIEIGLVPSTTGLPGGKQTGRRVSHYVREGGPFDVACTALLTSGFVFPYEEVRDLPPDPSAVRRTRSRASSKTPYTCPTCDDPPQRVWGRPRMAIICGVCRSDFYAEVVETDADPFKQEEG